MTAPHARTVRPGAGLRLLRAAVFAAVCVVLAAAGHALAACAPVPLWTLGAGFVAALLVVVPLAGRQRSLPGIAALLAFGQVALHTLFGLAGGHGAAATAAAGGSAGFGSMAGMPGMGPTAGMRGTGTAAALSDTELVDRAARLVCGANPALLSPGHAYRLLLDAHLLDPATARTPAAVPAHHAVTGPWALLPSLPMLLGHLLAALVAGWLLRRGDLALLRLISLSAHGIAEAALVRSLRAALALVHALCAGLLPSAVHGACAPRTAQDDTPAPRTEALQHTVIRRGPPAAAFRLAA
ncbi:hypothetical protein KUM39_10405 [Streptomyces sp. J2-1]|uniref:hypothetical protein n=1 Tax=Streptomyces corallincola TaxID=2851888 RepID=UPI001C395234|nr:hypothetical protein [Streptomyces corallincola]MBV2354772.1 hypothetical protein [Streptomyces corallincola]